ncbi:alpha/beta hydrolase [Pseudomonas sp. RP23018S]|uniref:alpha/beta hydrolase n=1 Tax=Pseudomonas sp. RP23018S TaxID=3096037 RepID=UPI002ACAEC47|nr:alpha/beta hydrolase [Pseudomonas sp. RP23018S]MDZ5601673.1 alpha/beta hydrolase [Pseudomonas sp. RP23018S]
MPLDPDLEGFLELAELGRLSGKQQPLHALSVAQARATFAFSSEVLDPSPPGAVQVSTHAIECRDGEQLHARLYRPAGSAEPLPCLLYFHGGGYVVGGLDSHDSVCRRLATCSAHAVLAPAYRLAPEQVFPTAVHDAEDSAAWLVRQAAGLGVDSARISVAGDSAGATLATVLAIAAARGELAAGFAPRAQLLFYPVTDTAQPRPSHARFAEGYLLESATLEWFYQHYLSEPGQRRDWRASPLRAQGLPALAPAYLSLAEYDPLYDEGLAYAAHLRASGTSVTLLTQHGLTHDFLRMSGITGQIDGIYSAVGDWLRHL